MHMSNASHLYRGILLISKIAVPTTYFSILIIIKYSKQFDILYREQSSSYRAYKVKQATRLMINLIIFFSSLKNSVF